jgi:hypothetical protein
MNASEQVSPSMDASEQVSPSMNASEQVSPSMNESIPSIFVRVFKQSVSDRGTSEMLKTWRMYGYRWIKRGDRKLTSRTLMEHPWCRTRGRGDEADPRISPNRNG